MRHDCLVTVDSLGSTLGVTCGVLPPSALSNGVRSGDVIITITYADEVSVAHEVLSCFSESLFDTLEGSLTVSRKNVVMSEFSTTTPFSSRQ